MLESEAGGRGAEGDRVSLPHPSWAAWWGSVGAVCSGLRGNGARCWASLEDQSCLGRAPTSGQDCPCLLLTHKGEVIALAWVGEELCA